VLHSKQNAGLGGGQVVKPDPALRYERLTQWGHSSPLYGLRIWATPQSGLGRRTFRPRNRPSPSYRSYDTLTKFTTQVRNRHQPSVFGRHLGFRHTLRAAMFCTTGFGEYDRFPSHGGISWHAKAAL